MKTHLTFTLSLLAAVWAKEAPAQVTPAPPPAKPQASAEKDLPGTPTVDPRVRLAEFARDTIGKKEEALYERLCRVRDAVIALKTDHKDRRLATVVALKGALGEIEATVVSSIDDTRKTADALSEYRRETAHAERAFMMAAQAWRDRALDFSTGSELFELNIEFAKGLEATAKQFPKKLERIDKFAAALPNIEAFLKDYKRFLTDFALYLQTVLDDTSEEPLKRFLDRKEPRHAAIDEYHRLVQWFTEGLRHGAFSKAIQAEVQGDRKAREAADRAANEKADALAREAKDRADRLREEERARALADQARAEDERDAKRRRELAADAARRQEEERRRGAQAERVRTGIERAKAIAQTLYTTTDARTAARKQLASRTAATPAQAQRQAEELVRHDRAAAEARARYCRPAVVIGSDAAAYAQCACGSLRVGEFYPVLGQPRGERVVAVVEVIEQRGGDWYVLRAVAGDLSHPGYIVAPRLPTAFATARGW